MLQNYSKSISLVALFLLPIWVFLGFYVAQNIVFWLLTIMSAANTSLGSINPAVMNTTIAAVVYLLTLVIVIGAPYYFSKIRFSLSEIGITRMPSWSDILITPATLIIYLIFSSILMLTASNILPWVDINQIQDVGFDRLTVRYEYFLAFVTLVVVAPIAEEVLFRGYLYGKLKHFAPVWVAVLITSVSFGFMHGAWNLAIDTFALSIVLCILRESTGSLWAPILLHMTKNGLAYYILFINPTLFTILK